LALFISLEGIDGSGKTTQGRMLAQALGEDAMYVREPGGTEAGEKLRAVLMDAETPLAPEAELLVFLAARAELVTRVIEPALAEGKTVVCDRFSDSTIAYQGAARGLGVERVRELCDFATGGRWPDLTLYLRVDPGKALSQLAIDDRFESEGVEFQRKIAAAYDALAAEETARIRTIDATGAVKQVHNRVMEAVEMWGDHVGSG
jgi:dTMP kinase